MPVLPADGWVQGLAAGVCRDGIGVQRGVSSMAIADLKARSI
jgi:hypothetical protein